MGEHILLAGVLVLALFGCAELIRRLVLRVMAPSGHEGGILVIPVSGHREDIEYIVRCASVRRGWGRGPDSRPILILDAGMDGETRRLAEAACAETKGVDLYTAETLAAYGRERVKILPEDLHYS